MVASQKVEGSSSLETCHLIGVYAYDLTLNDEDEAYKRPIKDENEAVIFAIP